MDNFGIADGLANHNEVQVLDFATGTGTFLHEAFQQILEMPQVQASEALRNTLVEEHFLKNFYGFEYLIAPYTIAHMKLAQFLRDRQLHQSPSFNILLTNTLDNVAGERSQHDFPFMQQLQAESVRANEIKQMPIRVIMGNPPYSGASKNKGPFDEVFKAEYAPRGETKMNWDDYEKFIFFAHQKMKNIERGVIGIITNNNFLNAITKRQMRNALMRDFSAIYILNLHGKQGDLTSSGRPDKNVFDITIGVNVAFFIRDKTCDDACRIFYASIKSPSKKDKWRQVAEADFSLFEPLDVTKFNSDFAQTRWRNSFDQNISLFVPSDEATGKNLSVYGDFWGLKEIFQIFGSGIKTERDYITIQHSRSDIEKVVQDFVNLSERDLNAKYQTPYERTDSRDWSILRAKSDICKHKGQDLFTKIQFRPFDQRFTYYTGVSKGFTGTPGAKISRHMLGGDNYGLLFPRLKYGGSSFCEVLVTTLLADIHLVGGQSSLAPLYIKPALIDETGLFDEAERKENFHPAFRSWLDQKYGKAFSPEQILGYIYAVLHSVTYRTRYNDLLKLDFPRIPFVDDVVAFESTAALGWDLIELHLMRVIPNDISVPLVGPGDGVVRSVEYKEQTGRIVINSNQYFENVPNDVWAFKIGGYYVLDIYLKERKKAVRPLTLDEIQHVPKIVNLLARTILQMEKIEKNFSRYNQILV